MMLSYILHHCWYRITITYYQIALSFFLIILLTQTHLDPTSSNINGSLPRVPKKVGVWNDHALGSVGNVLFEISERHLQNHPQWQAGTNPRLLGPHRKETNLSSCKQLGIGPIENMGLTWPAGNEFKLRIDELMVALTGLMYVDKNTRQPNWLQHHQHYEFERRTAA